MKKYLYIFIALFILVGATFVLMPTTYAVCNPQGGNADFQDIQPVTISLTSFSVSEDSINATVVGYQTMTVAPCSNSLFKSVTITGEILDSSGAVIRNPAFASTTIPANTSGNGYYEYTISPTISITPGAYKLKVTATSGGYTHYALADFQKSGSISQGGPLPKPVISLSANYYKVGSGAGIFHNPYGNNDSSGDPLMLTWSVTPANSICTKQSGAGWEISKPIDVPSTLQETDTFRVQCHSVGNNSEVTNAQVTVEVIPEPTATISISPIGINKGSDSIAFEWNCLNSNLDSGTIHEGNDRQFSINKGDSGKMYTAAYHTLLVDENLPESAPVNAEITCKNNLTQRTASAMANPATIFYDYLHWRGRIKSSCDSNTASLMTPDLENQVRFTAEIDKPSYNSPISYPNLLLNDGNDVFWGIDINNRPTYKVASVETSPTGYQYCGTIGNPSSPYTPDTNLEQIGHPDSSGTPVIYLDFAPTGTPTPTPPPATDLTVNGIGECRQNYPDTQTQAYLTWNAVEGATSYEVYYDRAWPLSNVLKGTTSNLFYAVVYNPAEYNKSYDYFVVAKTSTEDIQSPTITPSPTPANCNEPPTNYIFPTLDVVPSEATILVGQTTQAPTYTSLYDPDGPDSRYGQFNVTNNSIWSAISTTISTSLDNGIFQGNSIGTTNVKAKYNYASQKNLTALAQLSVNNNGADFSCSISPSLRDAQKPTSVSYDVTVSSLNNFSGNVALSVINLPSGITGSLVPVSVPVSNNGSANSVLTLNVSSSANIGRSTFGVNCVSGQVTHSDQADINVTSPSAFSCSFSTSPSSGSAPLTVSTSINKQGGIGPFGYAYWCKKPWNSADGTTQSGSCTYNTNGTYDLIGHVTDMSNNNLATCTSTVIVGPIVPPSPTPPPCDPSEPGCGGGGGGSMSCVLSVPLQPINQGDSKQLQISGVTGSSSYSMTFYPERKTNPIVIGAGYLTSSNPFTYQYNTAGTFTPMAIVKDINDPTKTGTCYAGPFDVNPVSGSCTLTANPTSILYGGVSKLTPTCSNFVPTVCSIDQGVGDVPVGQSKVVKPKSKTTYTLTCLNEEGGQVTDSAVVNVRGFLPLLREIIPR